MLVYIVNIFHMYGKKLELYQSTESSEKNQSTESGVLL